MNSDSLQFGYEIDYDAIDFNWKPFGATVNNIFFLCCHIYDSQIYLARRDDKNAGNFVGQALNDGIESWEEDLLK
jgi:hypothetical protein